LNLNSNIFSHNFAECGGAIKFVHKIPKNFKERNVFENNSANIFGKNYASEPFRFVYLQNQKLLSMGKFRK